MPAVASCRPKFGAVLISLVLFLLVGWRGYAGPTHELVWSFDVLPQNPSPGTLSLGPDGYYWGTAEGGGAYGYGAIYKVKADGTGWQTVLSFSGNGESNKGRTPYGGLVFDGSGAFWGTTQMGGAANLGTIFKVNAGTGVLTTMVEFTGDGATDRGSYPYAGLAADGAGFLWGTTQRGGAGNFGTVFKINPTTGVLATLVEFTDNGVANKGSLPQAGLFNDGAGGMWGTTFSGGSLGWGTVFKVNIGTGLLETKVEFSDKGLTNRGSSPTAGLVSDGAGLLWGTTSTGGALGYGTVYKIEPVTGLLITVVEFTDNALVNKGRTPFAGLIYDPAGVLWGTTYNGGAGGVGTIFKVHALTGLLTTTVQFTYNGPTNKGGFPSAGLVSDGAGSIWGTTRYGGRAALGTVFRLNTVSGQLTTVVDFTYDGLSNRGRGPYGGLVGDSSGALWGTTSNGGFAGVGTVFKLPLGAEVPTMVAEFGTDSQTNNGAYPYDGLTSDGAGFFWGTTQGGGSSGVGTIFKLNVSTGALATVVSFTGNGPSNKGSYPSAALVSDGAGYFWGTTVFGGSSSKGTLFKVNAATGVLTTLVHFTGNGGLNRGANPYGVLTSDGAGNLWGTTSYGGLSGFGTVFKLNLSSGQLTTVVDFTDNIGPKPGSSPWAGLVSDGAGNLWGTTQTGGSLTFGTLFKVNASTEEFTTILEFNHGGGTNGGATPSAPLFYDGAGTFWGTAQQGGGGNWGTAFKLDAASGELTTVVNFTGVGNQAEAGGAPGYGALHRHIDGNFYGVTSNGGPGGGGTVFRLRFGPSPFTGPASSVASGSAVLNATVNPNGDGDTAVNFEYGTSPIFAGAVQTADSTVLNGTTASPVAAAISGLLPGATYYYRVRASNTGNAAPQIGATRSFTMSGNGLPAVVLVGLNPTTVEAAAAYVDAGATAADPEDGPLTPTIATSTVVPNVVGTYSVTWQATDSSGGIASATRTVNVVDTTPPAVTPPANVTTFATSSAGAIVDYGTANASDAVGVASLNYTHVNRIIFPIGTTTVGVTAQDAAGNSATRTFTVTVSPSVATWREAIFGTASNTGSAADLADPNQNGVVNLFEYALNLDPLSTGSGNTLTQLSWSPGNRLQLSFTRYLDRADVNLFVMAADSPAGPWTELATSIGGNPFVVVTPGAAAVETGSAAIRQVTVTDLFPVTDPLHPRRFMRIKVRLINSAPDVLLIGSNIATVEAAAAYIDAGATALDADDGPLTPVLTANTVVSNVVGTYAVTWQATDSSGTIGSATRTVHVVDTTPPIVIPPSDVFINATGASGMVVSYPPATASDAVGVTGISYSHPSGSLFPSGTTVVEVTASDAAGHIGTAYFSVTVNPPPAGGALSVSPSTGIIFGAPMQLTATGWTDAQTPLTYQFFLDGGALNEPGSASTLGLVAPAAGTYTVRVRVTDALGAFAEASQGIVVYAGIASWRQTHFGTTNDAGDAADLADPNRNGLVNLVEYALGGDPVGLTTTSPRTEESWSAENHLQLTFPRYLDRTDLTLFVVAADSLDGPWIDLATSVSGAPFVVVEPGAAVLETGSGPSREVTVTDPFAAPDPAHPHRFLRLKIRR